MNLSKKETREIVGFTFNNIGSNSENWLNRAKAFKEAAEVIAKIDEWSPPIPYYYNAGLSLELILKAIAIAKGVVFEAKHQLNDLCRLIDLKITNDQNCTLEIFSELVVWSGRYPVPTKEGRWDNYHDVIQEKHVVRESDGNIGKVIANKKRIPSLQNYLILWAICESEYSRATKS